MAKLLMNLRHVPDDESDEICALLEERRIEFYLTAANRWGISAGGIWLKNDEDLELARELLAEYQLERQQRAQDVPTIPKSPLVILAYLAVIAFILYLSIQPFLNLGR